MAREEIGTALDNVPVQSKHFEFLVGGGEETDTQVDAARWPSGGCMKGTSVVTKYTRVGCEEPDPSMIYSSNNNSFIQYRSAS